MPVYTNFYFYSIINPEDFQLNHAKPILEEKGPYVFRWATHMGADIFGFVFIFVK